MTFPGKYSSLSGPVTGAALPLPAAPVAIVTLPERERETA
jgi:hypothetical protein